MTGINDIKAGRYELVAEHWDEILSKPGEPFDFVRHKRGEVVDLNVEDARRLVLGGAAVEPGTLEARALAAARAQLEAAQAAFDLAHNTELMAVQAADPVADPATPVTPVEPDVLDGSIVSIMETVGTDVQLAAELHDREKAKGNKARITLLEKLDAIVNPSPAS